MSNEEPVTEQLLRVLARAILAGGTIDSVGRELIPRIVSALQLDGARARAIFGEERARAAVPDSGATDTERLWEETRRFVTALPAGSGRRGLAERIGLALRIDRARVRALTDELALAAARPRGAEETQVTPKPAAAPDPLSDTRADGLSHTLVGRAPVPRPAPERSPTWFIDEAVRLGKLARDGASPDVARGVELVEAAAAIPPQRGRDRELALVALANLSAVVVPSGKLALVESALERLSIRPALAAAELVGYRGALSNAMMCVARSADPDAPARVLEAVEAAERLARIEPAGEQRWVVYADVAHQAVRFLATNHHWTAIRTLEKRLDAIPAEFKEITAPAVAGALTTWCIFAIDTKAAAEFSRARDRMARHAAKFRHLEVQREWTTLQNCIVSASVREQFPDTSEALVAASVFDTLVGSLGADRAIALTFAGGSSDLQLMVIAMRDARKHQQLLERIREIAAHHRADEEIAFAFARGIVNASIVCVKDVPPARRAADPILSALRQTLAQLVAAHPASANLRDAQGRFDRTVGPAGSAPSGPSGRGAVPASARPARVRHADIIELRRCFEELQTGSNAPMRAMGRILGTYPGRVRKEGEAVYAKDEQYFLDLLEEIEYQILNDRSGYWRIQGGMLESMTKYMLEDATPTIIAAARALRGRLGMAPW